MGADGDQRPVDCGAECESGGNALKQRLLAPKALSAAPDGSVYVADYNLVRRIKPDGEVSSVLKLK